MFRRRFQFLTITGIFIILWIFSAGWCRGQSVRDEIYNDICKTAGVYYAYPVAEHHYSPAPEGYKPFYISHYGRHGSRYLIKDSDYKGVLDLLKDAQAHKALTPLGEEVCTRLENVWKMAEKRGGDLSPLGVRQQRGIAERMFQTYPEVFGKESKIFARSTTVIRCILSMDAFCERLKEQDPQMQIVRDASERYMSYMNYHSEASSFFISDKGPWNEEYRRFEENHIHPQRLVSSLFSDSSFVAGKVNPVTFMKGLFLIAGDMQNLDVRISFYDLFQKEELFDLWQCSNYRFYVCFSNSPLNHGLALDNEKSLIANILECADQMITEGGNGADLRFGHDSVIVPLSSLMHLEKCDAVVAEPSEVGKLWNDFKVSPMAANIQIIFYKKIGSDDILVKFLQNEDESRIPVKSDILPYYHWKDVKAYFTSIIH